MERYDGKTKKDDYKKYALIGAGVVLLIILYNVLVFVVQKVSHPTPDVTVVFGAETVTDFQEEDDMERLLKQFATDLDGNGKVVVDVVPYDIRNNDAMDLYGVTAVGAEDGWDSFSGCLGQGEGVIFITHDRSLLPGEYLETLPEELASDVADYLADITGCEMLVEQNLGRVTFYAAIRKGVTQEEYDTAVAMIKGIMEN